MRIPRLLTSSVFAAVAAATLGATMNARAATNNRLDRDVLPTFQSVRLRLDPSVPDYSGSVHIDLNVVSPVTSFQLHAKDMDVIRVALTGPAGRVNARFEPGESGQLVVHAEQSLAAGAYGLDIDFQNDFGMRADGLYRVKSGENWYAYTQFEASAAREAFPCWDEPEFKIPYELTLTVPATTSAVSNTPIAKESKSGDRKTVIFKRTAPLPSYLVAICVGPFDFVKISGLSVPGRVVTVKGQSRLTADAVRVTPPILRAMEKYFGRRYPYEKLDLIAVPEFAAGAMENAGAITYREEILLLDPATASLRQKNRIISTTAHEVAHMWFGDLVTMEWWDDLWLNESFASWMGAKITHQLYPQFETPVRELKGTQRAMLTDARLSTRAIRQPVDALGRFDHLFDELAYQKGEAVLGMLEAWLDPETFRRGVIEYMREHEWKNATADDLWRALSKASGKDVTATCASFLDQSGLPLVSVELEAGGKVRLRQQRFLNFGAQAPREASWKIPVTLKYSDGRQVYRQSLLLEQAEQTVSLDKTSAPVWVYPNASESGYFRWLVPPAMLQAIAASGPGLLETRERVGFISNLSALLDAGLIHGDEYLKLLGSFADDPNPDVIAALIDGLIKVNDAFVTPDMVASYSLFVRQMMAPALRRFGMAKAKGETEPASLMRPALLSTLGIHGREPDVLAWAQRTARAYLERPASVDPQLAGAALNVAAHVGDLDLYEGYRTYLEGAKVPSERARFLEAMGHFRGPGLVEKALDYSLNGPLRPQERLTIPRQMIESDELRARTWRWMKGNFDLIVQKVPPSYIDDLTHFGEGCLPQQAAMVSAFFSTRRMQTVGIQQELRKVIDSANDCVGLRAREGPAVTRYMVQFAQSGSSAGAAPAR